MPLPLFAIAALALPLVFAAIVVTRDDHGGPVVLILPPVALVATLGILLHFAV